MRLINARDIEFSNIHHSSAFNGENSCLTWTACVIEHMKAIFSQVPFLLIIPPSVVIPRPFKLSHDETKGLGKDGGEPVWSIMLTAVNKLPFAERFFDP